jgi:16S rRNA (guanine527-N7)-methyltransferase
VDVGSGGGSPGVPLAAVLPDRDVTLLESVRRKCDFLEQWAPPNARVVWGRAEEQESDVYGVALAKALAQPATAVEWCLPLVRPGGAAVLWLGPNADLEGLARVSERVGGGTPEERDGLVVVPKLVPTPAGFPRRPGVAKKRPLA